MYSTSRRSKEAKPNANKCLSSNDLDLQQDKETDLKYLKHLYCLWGFEENVKKKTLKNQLLVRFPVVDKIVGFYKV